MIDENRKNCFARLATSLAAIGLLIAACDDGLPSRPENVPGDARYTGSRYSTGHWLHCKPSDFPELDVCTMFRALDGSVFRTGLYAEIDKAEFYNLVSSDEDYSSRSTFGVAHFSFQDRNYVAVIFVQLSAEGFRQYQMMRPECRDAISQHQYEDWLSLQKRSPNDLNMEHAWPDVFENDLARNLVDFGEEDSGTPDRKYPMSGCFVRFDW